MHYPVQLISVNETLSLYLPIPAEIKPAYEKILSEEVETPFPFWAKVWPSSLALSAFLELNRDLVTGKTVLEIGAGTGLPSFSIANIAASVIITDHAPDAVELMKKNIAFLGLTNVTARCLDWNQFPDDLKADIVLLSDINYAPEQFGPLTVLIRRFLYERSIVIIATPQRLMGASFLLQFEPHIRSSKTMQAEGVDISLLILWE